jgi:hypothetical protein
MAELGTMWGPYFDIIPRGNMATNPLCLTHAQAKSNPRRASAQAIAPLIWEDHEDPGFLLGGGVDVHFC